MIVVKVCYFYLEDLKMQHFEQVHISMVTFQGVTVMQQGSF